MLVYGSVVSLKEESPEGKANRVVGVVPVAASERFQRILLFDLSVLVDDLEPTVAEGILPERASEEGVRT